ncbi:MAG: ligase-associated DNA damage response endonuclease PdeM [Alphaproteobacteria bacterium]|nr:ligase-associated DNA damage response endonuclease PdeM [Alphaproteobacteria bacterium]
MTPARAETLATVITVNGARLQPDISGAALELETGALLCADLHLEKGSAYAARGQLLPPYDTRATLARLAGAIARLKPASVIALGDSFHDLGADGRMHGDDAKALTEIVNSVARWIWIEGNHDPVPPARFGGERMAGLRLGPLTLRHEPQAGPAPGEVAGHLHPCARINGTGRSVRRRCFATDGTRLVLPAFGAYAGGLNVRDRAFNALFERTPDAVVIGTGRVYPVPAARLRPD